MYNKRFCKEPEKIENYDKAKADNFIGWCCHHRLETHNSDGERRIVDIARKELKALNMYYNRPASELIFMKGSEHKSLHSKGKHHTEETRKKMAEAKKGKHLTEETRRKMVEAHKGKHLTEETRRKMAEAHKGEKNSMYGKHLSEDHKNKLREAQKGKNIWIKGTHWFNNGKISKRAKECPPGFVPGK